MSTFSRSVRLVASACALIGVAITSALAHKGPGTKATIAELTPSDALMVMSVDDWTKARSAFNLSAYGRLWQEPAVKEFVWSFVAAEAEEGLGGKGGPEWMVERLKEVGVDTDDLREPTGPVGASLYFEKAPAAGWPAEPAAPGARPAASKTDRPDMRPRIQFMATAEFGEGAASVDGAIEKMADDLKKKGLATIDEEQHEGQTIRVITRVKAEPEDADADAGDEDFDFDTDGLGGGPWNSGAMGTMRVTRVGTAILAATSKPGMESAIDRLLGKDGKESETLAASKSYQSALSQHPADLHGSWVILAGPTLRAGMRDAMAGMGPMTGMPVAPEGIIDALGLGAVEAISLGMRLDTDSGAAEHTLGLLAPEKRGLLAMIDAPQAGFQAPPFAPADSASLTVLGVRFDRIMEVVRGVYKAMPAEIQEQAPGALKAIEDVVTPVVNTLDREVCIVSSYRRPLSAQSTHTVMAIKLKDPLGLANLVTGFAGQAGFEPRDFQGNQIFESPGGGPVSVGIGAGYAFVGQAEDIENAMRLASDAALPKLSGSERFKASAAATGGGGNLYGFTNFAEAMAFTYWEIENAEKVLEAELDAIEMGDEDKKTEMDDFRENRPAWHAKLPPISALTRHLGDTVFEMKPSPDGFRGRWLILRPGRE